MTNAISVCPQCSLQNVYEDRDNFVCADCGHEWPMAVATAVATSDDDTELVKDANGTPLFAGDTVTLIKSLPVKGGQPLKQGTKVKNIRLVPGDHPIDCKIEGVSMLLKAEFVRKVQ